MQNLLKKNELILIAAWAILQTFLLYPHGMIITGEAVRIIREAQNLTATGHFSTPIYYTYLAEILLVYLKLKLQCGYGFILAMHLLLNLAALLYLHRFMVKFYSSKKLALIGGMLLLICFPYQQYNSLLYTESIFFSLSIIYSCCLLQIKKFSIAESPRILLLLILLCLTRPTGIFFFGATIFYLFVILSNRLNLITRIAVFIIFSAAGLFIVNFMIGTGIGINILLPFREEHIICDVPTKIYTGAEAGENSLQGLFIYLSHHPAQFARLAWLRSITFFGLSRPYYSFVHNLFMMSFFYPLYVFTLLSFARWRKQIPAAFVYFCSVILIFWIAVMFSCDEWHNRFFLTFTPFLILPGLYLFSAYRKE